MSRARYDCRQFHIDGRWVEPAEPHELEVIDPSSEEPIGTVALGRPDDVDRAVRAARAAFEGYSRTTRDERLVLLGRLLSALERRGEEIAEAITDEMGAPAELARKAQAASGPAHLEATMRVLAAYAFEQDLGTTRIVREPIGVCALITPWNWPINQIVCKVAPALAAGCTMVLKPSELAPLSAHLFARAIDEAALPPGVFNLVHGDGITAGAALVAHPEVDMVSFTGSTRAGIEVARAAAPTIKRVTQELGGKSACVILDDADLEQAVKRGVAACLLNSGQSCDAPTRMLVPADRHDEAARLAAAAAARHVVGPPRGAGTRLGPVAGRAQFEKVQRLIRSGIEEGAEPVTGGPGRPAGLDRGFYVRPTVFARVTSGMTIAREEIFGPVLSILSYRDEEDAVRIANDTPYGLSGEVWSGDLERARRVASRLRVGQVHLNGARHDVAAPFGGYKQSGNGREWGVFGLEEFLEVKSLLGYSPG